MSPADSTRPPTGQRSLAAIVFSDALGFSARVTENEERALRTIEADLALMADICARYDGQVVKNTGDGLMMLFSSAVHAVHCAIEIQRRLGEPGRGPSADRFEHRLGVHLGDVILTADDALGDGVNVAARLQEHAEPGGICMSQTVYEVVRNSLAVPVVGPEPLELKNIERVQALRIGPKDLGRHAPKRRRASGSWKGIGYAWITAGIIVLAGAIAFLGYSVMEGLRSVSESQRSPASAPAAEPGPEPPPAAGSAPVAAEPSPPVTPAPAPSSATLAPPPAPPTQETREPEAAPATPPDAPSSQPGGAVDPRARRRAQPGATPGATPEALESRDEVERRRDEARRTYQFGAFADWLSAQEDLRSVAPIQNMVRRYRALGEMMTWLQAAVAAATPERPLQLRADLASGQEEARAWGADGRVVFAGRGGRRLIGWTDIPPRAVGALIEAANRADPPTGREVQVRRAWSRAFTEEYAPRTPRAP